MAESVKDQMLEDEMAKDEVVEDKVDINLKNKQKVENRISKKDISHQNYQLSSIIIELQRQRKYANWMNWSNITKWNASFLSLFQ